MTADEKLAAILAAVQIDPGNRGLARDPHDNLFTACREDFAAACNRIKDVPHGMMISTGFPVAVNGIDIPETDGPLGAFFFHRAFNPRPDFCHITLFSEREIQVALMAAWNLIEASISQKPPERKINYWLTIERAGPAADGNRYSMRGRELKSVLRNTVDDIFTSHYFRTPSFTQPRIAIGDGGNEFGMGKIPHETIVKNIPNGDLIHCRVPADYLIVAGVSNWGAYALAAGVFVLRGEKPPPDLFDPDLEKRILEVMVREGPLVDGVTGEQTATVDGLSWNDYIAPFNRIREILNSD